MEPQVTICCSKRNQKCSCLLKVLYILILLFVFVVGIIIGAFAGVFVIIGLAYFAALATIFGVLAIITAIYIFCSCRN